MVYQVNSGILWSDHRDEGKVLVEKGVCPLFENITTSLVELARMLIRSCHYGANSKGLFWLIWLICILGCQSVRLTTGCQLSQPGKGSGEYKLEMNDPSTLLTTQIELQNAIQTLSQYGLKLSTKW